MELVGQYAGQAALLAPLVVAVCAALFQAFDPGTRYKPAVAAAVGIALGVALSATQSQRLIDGAWIGALSGLIAAGLYSFGRAEEVKANTRTLTQTTTLTTPPVPTEPPASVPR